MWRKSNCQKQLNEMTGGEAGEATRSGDGSKGSTFLYK